jgi:hypothetical protein
MFDWNSDLERLERRGLERRIYSAGITRFIWWESDNMIPITDVLYPEYRLNPYMQWSWY